MIIILSENANSNKTEPTALSPIKNNGHRILVQQNQNESSQSDVIGKINVTQNSNFKSNDRLNVNGYEKENFQNTTAAETKVTTLSKDENSTSSHSKEVDIFFGIHLDLFFSIF